MDRLKRYLIFLIIIYLIIAFVTSGINPFAWHWTARLSLVIIFVAVTSFFDLMFGVKK
jgi:uncharacterized membrane protein